MSLIDIAPDATPKAELLAKGFLEKTNQEFEALLLKAYDDVQAFWYRNKDADGNGVLEGSEPTGVEMLTAMGTDAQASYQAATRRAECVIAIAGDLGKPELIDLAKIAAPYDLTFNPDGSLNTATLRA